jgi:hypothetical protein
MDAESVFAGTRPAKSTSPRPTITVRFSLFGVSKKLSRAGTVGVEVVGIFIAAGVTTGATIAVLEAVTVTLPVLAATGAVTGLTGAV